MCRKRFFLHSFLTFLPFYFSTSCDAIEKNTKFPVIYIVCFCVPYVDRFPFKFPPVVFSNVILSFIFTSYPSVDYSLSLYFEYFPTSS